MVTVIDVAKYILHSVKQTSAMKLQKLCYYAQSWNLAWENEPMFPEDFQAWANGPVCRELYNLHQGKFVLKDNDLGEYKEDALPKDLRENIDIVIRDYGDMEPLELSSLTHQEEPWRIARGNLPLGIRGDCVISKESMLGYYEGLIS